jgi:hypothetical protein
VVLSGLQWLEVSLPTYRRWQKADRQAMRTCENQMNPPIVGAARPTGWESGDVSATPCTLDAGRVAPLPDSRAGAGQLLDLIGLRTEELP